MGQKTSPIGFRTGVTLGWQSTWFAPKANYGEFLVEDQKIRAYVDKKYNRSVPNGAVAKVQIIRTRNEVKVTLYTARPGVVIGPRGGEVEKLREELEILTGRKMSVNVIEIKEPDLNAALVADQAAANAVYDFLIDLMELQRAANSFDFFTSLEEREAWFNRMKAFFAKKEGEER